MWCTDTDRYSAVRMGQQRNNPDLLPMYVQPTSNGTNGMGLGSPRRLTFLKCTVCSPTDRGLLFACLSSRSKTGFHG